MSFFWESEPDWSSAPSSPTMPAASQDNEMDEQEFFRLLNLFPVVRSRSYRVDDNSSGSHPLASDESERSFSRGPSAARSMPIVEWQDAKKDLAQAPSEECGKENSQNRGEIFWPHLKAVAEEKLGREDAESFCNAFKSVHENLVQKALSLETINKIATNLERGQF